MIENKKETRKKDISKSENESFFSKMFNFYAPVLEIMIWIGLAFSIFYRSYLHSIYELRALNPNAYTVSLRKIIFDNYYTFIVSVLVALFPILTKLIFEEFPLRLIRNVLKKRREKIILKSGKAVSVKDLEATGANDTREEKKDTLDEFEESVLRNQIREATEIAERIYTRSGVYLLVGCLIAFVGVFIFYSPFFSQSNLGSLEPLDRLIDFFPRIAALFFVEFVAFFFLKQYRIMMEEYRYYEAIKRKKQNNYLIVDLIEKHRNDPDLLKSILANCSFSENGRKLNKEESTEILETQKIAKDEFNVIEKVLNLVKEIKK